MERKHFSKLGLCLFLGTLIITLVQLLSSAIYSAAAEAIPALQENSNIAFLVMMLPVYIIAYPIIFLLLKKVPSQETLTPKKMKGSHMFVAFLMLYAGTYVCNIIGLILTAIIGIFKQSTVTNVMVEITGSIHPFVNFLIVVICAPIMEELLFRKALIDRTVKYGEGVAVVLSGLLFALFHGNLNQFAYTLLMGCFFGFIYVKTEQIRYPIILHMLANFMGSFISSIMLKISGLYELEAALLTTTSPDESMAVITEHAVGLIIFFGYALCLIGFVIAGIVLFIINRKKFRLTAGEVTIEKGKQFTTVICNLGMGLYCIFWIANIILQLFQ